MLHRPRKGSIEPFNNFLNDILNKTKKSNKSLHIAGDFNLNVLDYDNCKKVQNFLNLLYQNTMIPIINKPTRVTRKSATAIDHIITNCFAESNFKTAIFKTDISDHFPIDAFLSTITEQSSSGVTYTYKRIINNEAIQKFLFFPQKKIKIKIKDIESPWITSGIKKSSKRKKRLYDKFLKNRNEKNEEIYTNYKTLFETIKKNIRKSFITLI